MPNPLDSQIARVLSELNKLKQHKMDLLQRRMRELQSGASYEVDTPKPQSRRVSDDKAKELLAGAVENAAASGISALKAAEEAGITYARARAMMPGLFRKTGTGPQTLYFPKRRRGKAG